MQKWDRPANNTNVQVASMGLASDFCHVRVDGCQAAVNCYLVGEGNTTPFDSFTLSGCA
jgi:hypothetical protein